MPGDMVSELRLATLYTNQMAHAIVQMDDRQFFYFLYHVIYPQYLCD